MHFSHIERTTWSTFVPFVELQHYESVVLKYTCFIRTLPSSISDKICYRSERAHTNRCSHSKVMFWNVQSSVVSTSGPKRDQIIWNVWFSQTKTCHHLPIWSKKCRLVENIFRDRVTRETSIAFFVRRQDLLCARFIIRVVTPIFTITNHDHDSHIDGCNYRMFNRTITCHHHHYNLHAKCEWFVGCTTRYDTIRYCTVLM